MIKFTFVHLKKEQFSKKLYTYQKKPNLCVGLPVFLLLMKLAGSI